ncbi:hypothetical protein ACFYO0_38120 [Streptomyces sp. NPDC006365]|uniref:hypothetical protein n=1 Tax=Streptomyces sp. NPDC006365 TaxID=3364744 RepID=UPI0036C483AC
MAGLDKEQAEEERGTEPDGSVPRPARLLHALALGCAVVLAWYAAFPLTDGLSAAQADDFGSAHWFPRALAAGAAVVLVLSMGRRAGALAAGGLAASAGLIGLVAYLTWERPERARILPPSLELRPAAPLALALMCAAVVLLCVPLGLRRRPWFGIADAAAGRAGTVRRRIRQVMATLIAGCLLGGLLSGAGSLGAALVRGDRETLTLPRQKVDAVPEERWYDGAINTYSPTEWPKGVPSQRAWERAFDSPVALSTCERKGEHKAGRWDEYNRGTVVGIDDDLDPDGPSVVGADARTGEQRWRYTVPKTRYATINQVGVGEGCAVLVLVGNSVTTLDAFDGSVRGRLLLSSPHLSEQTNVYGPKDGERWWFLTSTRYTLDDRGRLPRLVPLPLQDHSYLMTPKEHVLAVRNSDGRAAAMGFDDGACGRLVHGEYLEWGQAMVTHDCGAEQIRSFGLMDHEEEGETTPLLYGTPQMSEPVPAECRRDGTATATVSTRSRFLVLFEGCADDARGAWWAVLDPDPYPGDPMVKWQRWPERPSALREGTQPVVAKSGFVLPHREGMLVVSDHYRDPSDTLVVQLPDSDPAVAFAVDDVHDINSDSQRTNGLLVLGTSGRVHAVSETIEGENEFTVTDTQTSPVAPVADCDGRAGLLAAHTSPTMLLTCTSEATGGTEVVAYAGEARPVDLYDPDEPGGNGD